MRETALKNLTKAKKLMRPFLQKDILLLNSFVFLTEMVGWALHKSGANLGLGTFFAVIKVLRLKRKIKACHFFIN